MTMREDLSTRQLAAVLDNAPVAVYVSAVDDWKLLYANRLARDFFHKEITSEVACYTVAGFLSPCPFCRVEELNRSELLVREYYHPDNQRIYQFSGKIIDWGGKSAHIEYIVDITERKREDEELRTVLSSIPCGLCVYKVDGKRIVPVFHNEVFYDIMGYSEEHIRSVEHETNYLGVHPKDLAQLQEKIGDVLCSGGTMQDTYRLWNDKRQEERYIQLKGAARTREDGVYLYGVYTDVSEQKRLEKELVATNEKMHDTISAIPGGFASYRLEGDHFIPTFFSDGITSLSGHTREEYEKMVRYDALDIISELDRRRVLSAVQASFASGEILDISYRIRHKNGRLIWIHLNGRRIGPLTEEARFYAIFTGMSPETLLFQSIVDGTADDIYVIDKSNYELLYMNESGSLFLNGADGQGEKCYAALFGKSVPCEFCTLKSGIADGEEHEMEVETGRFYSTRFRNTEWNGIPAYVKYVRDITQDVLVRREKERLEMYFKSVVDRIPGGICVIRIDSDGKMTPEFVSDGLAALLFRTAEEIMDLYRNDILAGIHPDDAAGLKEVLNTYLGQGGDHCDLIGRLLRGDGTYIWVKNICSIKQLSDGIRRLYCTYMDISEDMEEKETMCRQYEELILQHYRTPGPDSLFVGHSNITRNRILENRDFVGAHLFKRMGTDREKYFFKLAEYIVDETERKTFLERFLNAPLLKNFADNIVEQTMECFIRLPQREKGCYAQFKVNLVEKPDTGDLTGVLTVTDITDQAIANRILHQLSLTSHDYIVDLNLNNDSFKILSRRENSLWTPETQNRYSAQVAEMAESVVVPGDKERYKKALDAGTVERLLKEEGAYTFSYSIMARNGDIQTKNMTISPIDLRLGRACLVCTDITDSMRKQQGLLNMIAYTFDLAGLIHVESRNFTMYTSQTILENRPPFVVDDYNEAIKLFIRHYELESQAKIQFALKTMIKRLSIKPSGYDFVLPYIAENGLRYKQINVLWGDRNHRTICLVRADVTDMMTAERRSQKRLEKALAVAEKANQAKSEFLSSMSHDIRTPMNAIMGMTTLAMAQIENQDRVEDCLRKIAISSKHLLSLVNDVLDMSKIERSQISLNDIRVNMPELIDEISAIIAPQTKLAGLHFDIRSDGIIHPFFYGDSLRVNQILINILSNAVKFTPEGGTVTFLTEEISPPKANGRIRYRFTVKDTGIGMSKDFLNRIYDPFARDNSVLRIEGTGLGLSITKGLVDLMGGEIFIESRQGSGSVFRVELEFDAAQEMVEACTQTKGIIASAEEFLAERNFLIVEDNDINAEILSEILAMYQAHSVITMDGAQAVKAFQDAPPKTYDAILMDIQMPVMDGYEATRTIRAINRPDASDIPIIAMTANAFAEDIRAALEAGMDAHVAKPIDTDVLMQALRKAIR